MASIGSSGSATSQRPLALAGVFSLALDANTWLPMTSLATQLMLPLSGCGLKAFRLW